MMMNIFYLIFLSGFICVIGHCPSKINQDQQVKLTIKPENSEPINVYLRKTDSFLANSNLPMWKIHDKKLIRVDSKEVMQQLGPFTVYQDRVTSSAAVHFHKRNQLDGTVDIRYIITGLVVYDNIDDKLEIKNHVLFERRVWGHDKTFDANKRRIFPEMISQWIGRQPSIKDKMGSKKGEIETYYIETLVVINYDLAEQLLHEYKEGYASYLSYVLTLFNSVDMLYSKIDTPKIRINIAGIIVGHDRESFPFLSNCYREIDYNRKIEALNVACSDKFIENYLLRQKKLIPLDSYDNVIILTRYQLYMYEYNNEINEIVMSSLGGITYAPHKGIYEYKRNDVKFKAGITVKDKKFFGSYPVIAHEMIHSFGIATHDEKYEAKNGICCNKLMKEYDNYCQYCLDWSDKTKEELYSFFKTPHRCIFKNKPRSLYPPGPRIILTADEQCQCYGYNSEKKNQKTLWNKFGNYIFGYCNNYLTCEGAGSKSHTAPVPVDGTPCDNEDTKVCWNRLCQHIDNKEEKV